MSHVQPNTDDLFAPRPPVERPYFKTTAIDAVSLREAVATAERQDEAVLAILLDHKTAMPPSRVHALGQQHGRKWLLTSVRRSMSNLAKSHLLRKEGVVPGPHGRPEHTWKAA